MAARVCVTHLGGGHNDSSRLAPWVRKDVEILAQESVARPFFYGSWRDIPALALSLMTSDVSVNWFAWDNALWSIRLGKLLRVPGIVIVAGFDVADVPDAGYGALRTPRGRDKVRTILTGAAHVFALSEFLRESALGLARDVPIELLYLGFDSAEFPPGPPTRERRGVCTIGDVDQTNLRRKGIGDVMEVARYLDDIPISVVGRISPNLRGMVSRAPRNVRFLDHVPRETLVEVLHDSRVYLQLSRHEGFGSAVAEAMLCRCVPVVYPAGALPEVVGDAGFYAEPGDPERTAEVIRRGFEDSGRGDAARERIGARFPLARRRSLLLRRVEEATSRL